MAAICYFSILICKTPALIAQHSAKPKPHHSLSDRSPGNWHLLISSSTPDLQPFVRHPYQLLPGGVHSKICLDNHLPFSKHVHTRQTACFNQVIKLQPWRKERGELFLLYPCFWSFLPVWILDIGRETTRLQVSLAEFKNLRFHFNFFKENK